MLYHHLVAVRATIALFTILTFSAACGSGAGPTPTEPAAITPAGTTLASALAPAPIAPGERLRVVATTTLIGDAVARVAGDLVDLSVLLPAGSDPHTYVATPQDQVALADAQVVFINGLGLEESLLPTLGKVEQGPVVSVNQDVAPLAAAAEEEEVAGAHGAGEEEVAGAHGAADPHTWQDVRNVELWAATIAEALARLDPANATAYEEAASAYRSELQALHSEVAADIESVPAERRLLVTDHDDLAYFAAAYGMKVVGAVTPSFSSMATISAQEMAALQDQIKAQGVPAIFVGSTVNPQLAEQVAKDTGAHVVALYTDSLGAPDGPAASYVTMMRTNAQTIAEALK